ncbi:neutral/alkaline nonlysosomal ceramidase [Marssonina coronariae]|uniref:ceramidase n=1 Tax=Diplocarpon coronariae TaxID=2795749 RepID=A0A218YWP3_9HELO|nr:neutral/alkaline nonlysosomal ceramidase [Marssonina coronariae]
MSIPYAWSPNIIGVQFFRVGQLIMIISPSEGTTMTGRRWKAGVSAAAVCKGTMSSTPKVVLGGPANTYAHYAATPEEHGIQRRYEGTSTIYGQREANAYMYLLEQYIGYFSSSNSSQRIAGSLPPNNVGTSISLIEGVPKTSYTIGSVMNATSVGAYPRNNLRQEGTSAEVQKSNIRTWIKVRDNADWFLLYPCYRDDSLLSSSHVVLNWEMESVLLRARIGPSSIRTAT